MTLYFYACLDPSMFWMMIILYFAGIILIFVDGEFVNNGTLAGIGATLTNLGPIGTVQMNGIEYRMVFGSEKIQKLLSNR